MVEVMIRRVCQNEMHRRAIGASLAVMPLPFYVTVGEPPRTLDQNAAQWPILEAFSKQLQWPVNDVLTTLTPEEWKDMLTAAFYKEVRMSPGLTGGTVMHGHKTSKMPKPVFSEYLSFINAMAADLGVELSE